MPVMDRDLVLHQLQASSPLDTVEHRMREQALWFVQTTENFWSRDCREGHLTASAWITDPGHTRVLLLHHGKLKRWLQPGGHIEALDGYLWRAALREAQEETGLRGLEVIPAVFDVDVHWIPGRGAEPPHQHYDVRMLMVASPDEPLVISPESREMAWFDLDEAAALTSDASILRPIEKTRLLQDA